MRKYVAITSTLLLTLTSGCLYELRDEFAETRIGWGNKFAASSAWSNSKGLCTGLSCPHSFKEGFMSGYTDVANGGNGCPPAFPIIRCHNHMWMDWCSESEKMEAWYDGYEIGAMSAKGDGMADSNRIVTRIPHANPVDYSGAGHNHSGAGPEAMPMDSAVPPAPIEQTPATSAPQAQRLPQVFE